jgi:hypothetical protein
MKAKIITFAAILTGSFCAFSQGFVNLNFESANVSGYPPNSFDVPIANALPGWNAYLVSSEFGTQSLLTVWYDVISIGGAGISVIDANATPPLQGSYSAFLFGGTVYSAEISQTAVVPTGSESLFFDASVSGAPFDVTLGSQSIDMIPLQTFSNYTLYGGNISPTLAGNLETLSFTEPAPTSGPGPNMFKLDDIQFSASPVPEPNSFGLFAFGGLFIALRHWRKVRRENSQN